MRAVVNTPRFLTDTHCATTQALEARQGELTFPIKKWSHVGSKNTLDPVIRLAGGVCCDVLCRAPS